MSTPRATSITWPMVAILALLCSFLLGIFVLIPDDEPQSRTALLGFVLLAGQAAVGYFMRSKVNEVQDNVTTGIEAVAETVTAVDKKVNGRMTQLIEATQRAADEAAAAREELAAYRASVEGPERVAGLHVQRREGDTGQ